MLQRWDFNDIEALRSFEDAITVANESSMLHWGRAYVLGPGTNRHAQFLSSALHQLESGSHLAAKCDSYSVRQP